MTSVWLRWLFVLGLGLQLSACAIGKPAPQATTYVLEPPAPALRAARRPETLRLGKVRVTPAFAGRELVFRLDDVRYVADFYNAFLAEPGAMIGVAMAQWLEASGLFKAVMQADIGTRVDVVLEARVTELYGDFRPGRSPAAVMRVQFALVDLTGVSTQVSWQQTIGRRIAVPEASPEALVRGYGQALGDILMELAAVLEKAD
ncbi:hypothetical protein G3480_04765 [Thiorhodococcus mannitoliphagus]|uniref:ABC-type transport auxiliary lipoprotein component domain-containing protein n=1 Tax=Thiorhodococcus mannitoliphagus TaxID=329406 RepID=A0A6P1DPZ5_9GAMM|nr:ABC-type transport auxiliary lipoprotein family protein [Thiorhodococcus mannitoliphagus]NEX19630.1 hypothetical protein [Thiorhodococcus mannitoliphagus]